MQTISTSTLLEQTARSIYPERGRHTLHARQWAILRLLAEIEADGASISALATRLDATHAPVQRAVEALKQKGLVEVARGKRDKRLRVIRLSQAGRTRLTSDPINRLADAIKGLPAEQRGGFLSALRSIHDRL